MKFKFMGISIYSKLIEQTFLSAVRNRFDYNRIKTKGTLLWGPIF
jgi:hypothetical protein